MQFKHFQDTEPDIPGHKKTFVIDFKNEYDDIRRRLNHIIQKPF